MKLSRSVGRRDTAVVVDDTAKEPKWNSQEVGVEIEATVLHFGHLKAQEKDIKAGVSKDKSFIMKYFEENDLDKFEIDGLKVSMSTSESVSFNMEALIPHIKKLMKTKDKAAVKGLVKRREYVDETMLEDLIYNGVITEEEVEALAEFQVVKTTSKLLCKQPKK